MAEMTEEEIARKILDGDLPPDFDPSAAKKKVVVATEEELAQKIMDGEIDPADADKVKVSKSAWRKQKGKMSKQDATTMQKILDGEVNPDADEMGANAGLEEAVDEAEMMRRIMDGEGP
eukprot:m.19556 g.19556  ORF g.19556 m.19556 type:complete len:119 (+) comp6611_c0_seq1:127-483(+)